MLFTKLDSTNRHQNQFGKEVTLVASFIEYYYYEREHSVDSHDRIVIVVKYGNDLFRIKKDGNNFEEWFKSQKENGK